MKRRFRAAWRAFWHPEFEEEALDVLHTFYDWTLYKATPWALKAARLLRQGGRYP